MKDNNNSIPLKILHVVGCMDRGGAESRIMDVYRNMDPKRAQFDFLVYTQDSQDYEAEIKSLGGRLIYIEPVRESGIFTFLKNFVSLAKTFGPYDAIHAHTSYNSALVLFAAWIAKIPKRIYHARNSKCIGSVSSIREKVYICAMKLLMYFFCNERLAVGEKAAIAHFGKMCMRSGKVRIVANSVDIGRFVPASDREAVTWIRHELRIPDASLYLGHVGNFRPEKNHKFLFAIFEMIYEKNPDSVLLLIGDDRTIEAAEYKRSIQNLPCCDRICFLGKRNDVEKILLAFDVMLFPSIREGIPGSTLEAQAAGIPCVISDTVDPSIDMNLGLVKWMQIQDPAQWVNVIPGSIPVRIWNKTTICDAFTSKKYTIETTSAEWLSCYV
ncbi:MAG: glycosyltransferase [Sphaerochaetaceae bacterium]|nr:glycosyltransferase [Sphaerochaetaceae bacterium]